MAGAAAPRNRLDQRQLLDAWMRLAGAMDERLVIWWMEGLRYGVIDARSRLLYGMQVGIFQKFFAQPDGSWKIAMFELTYYTDLESGELLREWRNPYTGETNRVRHVRLGPEIRLQTAAGQSPDPDDAILQSMVSEYHTTLGPEIVSAGQIWLPTSVEGLITLPSPKAPPIRLNHYTTVSGSLSDALNPDTLSAPSTIAFQNVLHWEPWMSMGDHPGHLMSRAAGRKMERIDELPAVYLAMAREVHPKLIADPEIMLSRVEQTIRGSE